MQVAPQDAAERPVASDPPRRLTAPGEFCRRHDVLPSEAVWGLAHAAFFALILAAWARSGITAKSAAGMLALNATTLIAALAARPWLRKATTGPLWILRHWYPVLYYGMFFLESGVLVPALNSREFDAELAAIDRSLFGADPTVWMGKLHHPLLSEYLQFCYATYYFLPLFAGGQVMAKKGARVFGDGLAVMSLAFYASYVSYFLVPAVGPRFTIAHPTELNGLWTFAAIRNFLGAAEGKMHDCFPSGHTAVTLITLLYAWRSHKPTFWGLLPFALGLIFSTVYLRYHYVVDLIAAVPFTFLVLLAGWPLVRAYGRFRGVSEEELRTAGPFIGP
jgi:membrane-associated phospholipid phosphatase